MHIGIVYKTRKELWLTQHLPPSEEKVLMALSGFFLMFFFTAALDY